MTVSQVQAVIFVCCFSTSGAELAPSWADLNQVRLAGRTLPAHVQNETEPAALWITSAVAIAHDAAPTYIDQRIDRLEQHREWRTAADQLRAARAPWRFRHQLLQMGLTGFAIALGALLVYGSQSLFRLHTASKWGCALALSIAGLIAALSPEWAGTAALVLCGMQVLFHAAVSMLGGTLNARFASDRKIRSIVLATFFVGCIGLWAGTYATLWMASFPYLGAPVGHEDWK